MRKSLTTLFACAVVLALAIPVFAGGFYLITGNPDASPAAKSMNAVLTIKASGCGDPDSATINATAIGMVDGRRESIALKLVRLEEPGMYAVTQQWPAKGRWVLQFLGRDHDRVTHTLVPAGPSGGERQAAKFGMRLPTDRDVAQLLEPASASVSGK